jgi:hypothetical protein
MGTIWSKEPAVVIGFAVSVIVLVAQQLLTSGIVSSAGAVSWTNLVISVAPLIGALLTRGQVTPTP